MSDELEKMCIKCGDTRLATEFRQVKDGRYLARKCLQCERLEAKDRMAQWRLTADYREWVDRSRGMRRKFKEKYRREKGSVPVNVYIEVMALRRIGKAQRDGVCALASKNVDNLRHYSGNLGIPREITNRTEVFRYKYVNDGSFQFSERRRVRAAKANLSMWYVNQQMGATGGFRYPDDLLLAKQAVMAINRLIRGDHNAQHNRSS